MLKTLFSNGHKACKQEYTVAGGISAIAKAAVTVINFTTGYSNHKILSVGNWASKTWYTQ